MKVFRATIRLMYAIAFFWVLFGFFWLTRDSDYRFFYFVSGLGYAFVIAACAYYLNKKQVVAWWTSLAFLTVNIVLTIADEFGWFDFAYLIPSVMLFGLLFVIKNDIYRKKSLYSPMS